MTNLGAQELFSYYISGIIPHCRTSTDDGAAF